MSFRLSPTELQLLLERNKNIKLSKRDSENESLSLMLKSKTKKKRNRKTIFQSLEDLIENTNQLDPNINSSLKKKAKTTMENRKKADNNVLRSVVESEIVIEKNDDEIYFLFKGAKAFTLNEILRLLEFKKNIIFKYKKIWQNKVNDAVLLYYSLYKEKPYFDSCELTLCRTGKREVDLDSLQTMFKYLIDAFRYAGVIADDNPNIIKNIKGEQNKSDIYSFGVKIRKLN